MILKALYDYYNRREGLPTFGMEEKQIGFLLILNKEGKFLRFEDCRIDKNTAMSFLVKKSIGKTSAPVANYLYDNSAYVMGYSNKDTDKEQLYLDTFKAKIKEIAADFPNNPDIKALSAFYEQKREDILLQVQADPLWEEISKNLSKKFSLFSFRIEGDTKIIAEKKEILKLDSDADKKGNDICLVTGRHCKAVETTTATMIPGSQATAKLVSFQINSGYDSYGKSKGNNAPISQEAEFAYTTALNVLLSKDSRNKFTIGSRTFLFWASSNDEGSKKVEESFYDMFAFNNDYVDPNQNIEKVKKVFKSIFTGQIRTDLNDTFYILGLAPNVARLSVVYWAEIPLKRFAEKITMHFNDMEILDTRKEKKPYMRLRDMLSAVTLNGKVSEVTPNLPDAVVKSIFEGLPYPYTLFSSCIRRIKAERDVRIAKVAIIKAYLNRLNTYNNKKIEVMLDKENKNPGYICGRLFAVLDKIQEDANHINSIRERYMSSASSTPSAVFATLLNLSYHHSEKLNKGSRIYYEKLKQEIIDKIPAFGFPTNLCLQDQGRFFVGYYHQRQDLFTNNQNQNATEE
jgi:CRISPR-associated protein Csd1